MAINPMLKQLGFSPTDRVVIIHADDIGMCQASTDAFPDLWDFGLISAASTMVPCPWFPKVAAYCRSHSGLDMGVHFTLTCEWETFRWGPISTRAADSGLLDDEGYFYRSSDSVFSSANPAAVGPEIEAQVARALQAGIDVTHVDHHMLALGSPQLFPLYVDAAIRHRLPLYIERARDGAIYPPVIEQVEAAGLPVFDDTLMMPLDGNENRLDAAKRLFNSVKPGLTYFILHPSKDTPELRAIAPDWRYRVGDYETFTSTALRDYVRASGIQVIGYRAIRDAWRAK